MQIWLRFLVIAIIILSTSSFTWYLLGSTAFFQRGMDIIGTTILLGAAIPVLVLSALFVILLVRGWAPTSGFDYIGISIGMIISVLLSIYLIQSVSNHGWLHDNIRSDPLKITLDEKYEYRLELINMFQRNSYERLYIRDISTGEDLYVSVNIDTSEIYGMRNIRGEDWAWAIMIPTNLPDLYELSTTDDLPVPKKRFIIHVKDGTSKTIKN